MKYQFRKHYSREEARALLPQLRKWLATLDALRLDLQQYDQRIAALIDQGNDAGGDTVNRWVRTMANMRELLAEFESRQILIKDLDRGLIDFPSIVGGREVFLCWEKDEDDIEFWHELDTGFAGRERL